VILGSILIAVARRWQVRCTITITKSLSVLPCSDGVLID
jgi:hypothetical protein